LFVLIHHGGQTLATHVEEMGFALGVFHNTIMGCLEKVFPVGGTILDSRR
jgi:hypothetical protein